MAKPEAKTTANEIAIEFKIENDHYADFLQKFDQAYKFDRENLIM
jgi:hypothetical protein